MIFFYECIDRTSYVAHGNVGRGCANECLPSQVSGQDVDLLMLVRSPDTSAARLIAWDDSCAGNSAKKSRVETDEHHVTLKANKPTEKNRLEK